MKNGESLLRNVTEQLNRHEYTDLTKFLDGIDWFSIPHEQIVPREKVRAFVKSIEKIYLEGIAELNKLWLDPSLPFEQKQELRMKKYGEVIDEFYKYII